MGSREMWFLPVLSLVMTACMAPMSPASIPLAVQAGSSGIVQAELPIAYPNGDERTPHSTNLPLSAIDAAWVASDQTGVTMGAWGAWTGGPGPAESPDLPIGFGVFGGSRYQLADGLHIGWQLTGWPLWASGSGFLVWQPLPEVALVGGVTAMGALLPEWTTGDQLLDGSLLPSGFGSFSQLGPVAGLHLTARFGFGVSATAYQAWRAATVLPAGRFRRDFGIAVSGFYVGRARP